MNPHFLPAAHQRVIISQLREAGLFGTCQLVPCSDEALARAELHQERELARRMEQAERSGNVYIENQNEMPI
jgi:hypothetical protein